MDQILSQIKRGALYRWLLQDDRLEFWDAEKDGAMFDAGWKYDQSRCIILMIMDVMKNWMAVLWEH